jgi:hypothetical protein
MDSNQRDRAIRLLAGAVAGWMLAGCAQIEHYGWKYLTTTTKAAQLQAGGQRLTGEVQLRPDRTGSALLMGSGELESCAGSLRFTGVNSGALDMRCSDGSVMDMPFTLLNEVKGYAIGSYQGVTAVLTFGMEPAEAQAYLARAQSVPSNIDSNAGKPLVR